MYPNFNNATLPNKPITAIYFSEVIAFFNIMSDLFSELIISFLIGVLTIINANNASIIAALPRSPPATTNITENKHIDNGNIINHFGLPQLLHFPKNDPT